MNGRYCIGSQPFKYFVETDPTVPQWVKKITIDDIQNWNTVLNKQDKLIAGQHIIIDGNEISFDHTIDEPASDFNYFKIGDERLYNDLRNYFITINEEEFIPIDILTDTAYMQWQDGLYYEENSSEPIYNVVPLDTPVIVDAEEFATGGDLRNTYFLSNGHGLEYELYLYPSAAGRDEQGFIDNIIRINNEGYDLAYIDDSEDYKVLVVNDGYIYVDNVELTDQQIIDLITDNKSFYKMKDGIVNHKIYMFSGGDVGSDFYYYDDSTLPIYRSTEIIAITKTYTKVLPEDIFDNTKTYCVYNRKTDTYSIVSLNENTFKERQNGLYIRTSIWNKDTLLTAKNIDQLLYDLADTAFGKAHERAYSNFVTYELKNYVTGRISALHIEGYLQKITFTNKMNDIENTLKNLQGVVNETNISIGGKQDTLSVIGDGLVFKSPHDYDGSQQDTTNKILSLGLDIWDDAHSNEYYKDEYRTERGYNGDDFGNLVHFHYKDTDNKIYLAVPFSKRLMYEDVAISSKAILNELNLNYEMKLATLDSNINFVDLDYYKNKWGVTGENFTKDDYKTLLKEWYSIELDANDPNNQTLVNLYSYDGHNDKYYGRQRAIVLNLSTGNEIYTAVEWLAIENHSESDFNNRTESWWYSDTIDGVKNFLSEDDEYPGNDKYYWKHGDIKPQTTIPSVDAVARFVESLDLDYTDGKVYLSITERPNTDYAKKVDIDNVTIVDDTTKSTNTTWSSNKIDTEITNAINALDAEVTSSDGTNVQVKVTEVDGKITDVNITTDNTINSTDLQTALSDYVTLATTQTITGNKTFSGSNTFSNVNTFTNQIVLQGVNSMIVGSSDGLTKKALLQRTSLNNTNLIVLGNTSDTLELRGIGTRPTYNSNEQLALLSDVTSLPEPMIFKGSVGSGGTIEWSSLPSTAASNKGFTYKVIEDHNTAPICKVGDTIISDSTTWVVIPSGDEPSGTVTNVAIQGETNYIEVSGSPITSSGTITISLNTAQKVAWNNKISGVKVNGTELTADANKKVNVIVPQVYRYV